MITEKTEYNMDEPLIASKILSYMGTDDVRRCRLVSRIWNIEAVTTLSRMGFAFPLRAEKKEPSLNFSMLNSTLAKRVKIQLPDVFPCKSTVPKKNLMSIFALIGEKFEHLHFEWGDEWANVLAELLNTYALHNLVSLKIMRTEFISLTSDDAGDCMLRRDEFQKLKEISFTLSNGGDGDGEDFFPVLQNVINKAPNLEILTLGTNFYPDLTKLTILKSLNLINYSYRYEWPDEDDEDDNNFGHTCSSLCTCDKELRESASFKLAPLKRMLTEVTDTLEILELHDEPQHNYGIPNSETKRVTDVIPSMLKLNALHNYAIDTFPFYLSSKRFPQLNKLLIRPECNTDAVNVFMKELAEKAICLPEVKIFDGIGLKVLSTVPKVLPNLISVNIEEIFDYAKMDSTADAAEFTRKCCTVVHGLPLLQKVSVKSYHSNYNLRNIFRNLNMFVGCKELRQILIDFTSGTATNHGSKLDEEVKNILLKFKGSNKSVKIHGFKMMNNIFGESVKEFVTQQNLPINW